MNFYARTIAMLSLLVTAVPAVLAAELPKQIDLHVIMWTGAVSCDSQYRIVVKGDRIFESLAAIDCGNGPDKNPNQGSVYSIKAKTSDSFNCMQLGRATVKKCDNGESYTVGASNDGSVLTEAVSRTSEAFFKSDVLTLNLKARYRGKKDGAYFYDSTFTQTIAVKITAKGCEVKGVKISSRQKEMDPFDSNLSKALSCTTK